MRYKYGKIIPFLVCVTNTMLFSTTFSQSILPEALQMDLKRIEETWRILDKYAEQAWPGWSNYTKIPIRLDYPNGISLQIIRPEPLGNFKLIEHVTLRGKKIYLDDSKMNSLVINSRLIFKNGSALGLGHGHPSMYVTRDLVTKAIEDQADSLIKNLGNPSWPSDIVFSTDNTIFSLTHELFHCFADYAAIYWSDDTPFEPDLNYAVFSEIEGDLLEKAAFESDSLRAKEYLKKSLIAREMKRSGMSKRQKEYESDREKCEGTADYATYRIVQFSKNGYKPGLTRKDDPLYFGFHYCDYFLAKRLYDYRESFKNTLVAGIKCYGNGFLKCLILDMFIPQWKIYFFEKQKSFDDFMAQIVNLREGNTDSLLETIKKEYQYEKLVQRHSPLIAERDSIIHYFQNPNLHFYVINIEDMAVDPNIASSGTQFWHGSQQYYSSGTTNIQVGDMTYYSKGIPICSDIPSSSIKLPDLDFQKDLQSYDLKYSQQEADGIYSNVTITTKNFTLHATKLQIIKSPLQTQFRILPAVK